MKQAIGFFLAETKNLRNQLKRENIPTTMIEGNMALHNCY